MTTPLLPFYVSMTLQRTGAPVEEFSTLDDVVAWTETNLAFDFTCGPHVPGSGNAGRARHRMQVNPHTGNCTSAPTADQQVKADGVHLLAALTGRTPECQRISEPFTDWVGPVHPGTYAPWPKHGAGNGVVASRRDVVRVVQFIDEGLDLHTHEAWLRIGARTANVVHAHDRLDVAGIRGSEDELCKHLAVVTGSEFNGQPGRKAETSSAWLNRDIDNWVNAQAATLIAGATRIR